MELPGNPLAGVAYPGCVALDWPVLLLPVRLLRGRVNSRPVARVDEAARPVVDALTAGVCGRLIGLEAKHSSGALAAV